MNNRWIDQYFLRYAVGTVFGAVIVAFLSRRLPPTLHAYIPHFDTWGKIVALTAAGLAFCYIASAPLLVCHVGRYLWLSAENEKKRVGVVVTIVSTLLIFAAAWLIPGGNIWRSLSFAAVLGTSIAQLTAVFVIHRERKGISDFYNNLALARKAAENLDIVESYRGIREHANAYSIVLFEVLLGMILTGLVEDYEVVKTPAICFVSFLGLAGAWVIPSCFVLSVAARIETDFVDSYLKKVNTSQS